MSCKILSDSDHIARKQHPCIWCREPIDAGEQYHVQTCIFECEWQSNKYHTECFEAATENWDFYTDGGFPPHSFKRGTSEEA